MHLARVEAGESTIENCAIMLGEFLDDIKSGYQAPLDKPVSLNWSWPKDLPTIQSDQAKLMIILQNLIDNAIKFTDEGQITISARRATKDNAVEIDVADTGIGIPKDAQLLIFERFHQVDSSSTRSHGGVGLGLYIVKVLTELLGATIAVKSQLGKGTTFTLRLPVSDTP
jgi:signal transduction histidine kinase